MAAALSIKEYTNHFLLVKTNEKEDEQENGSKYEDVLLVHVNQTKPEEHAIYSRKIIGKNTNNVFLEFCTDMIPPDKQKVVDRITPSGVLEYKTSVDVNLISAKCPGKVGAEHLQDLLNECKRRGIKMKMQIKFAHSYSWENKYNRIALKRLSSMGVRLSSMCTNSLVNHLINDVEETLLSLDQLQTCRGTLHVNELTLRTAISAFRNSICLNADSYFNNQKTTLNNMLALQMDEQPGFTKSHTTSTLSIATYRDYFLLQNSDHVWGKLKVDVNKIANGTSKNKTVFDSILFGDLSKNNSPRTIFGKKVEKNKKKKLDNYSIWKKIGTHVTLQDLSESSRVDITLNLLISEYPDTNGMFQEVRELYDYVQGKLEECDMTKARVEISIRYAQIGSHPTSNGDIQSKNTECLHVHDILFEMLEDLEDNLQAIGRTEFNRGNQLVIYKEELSTAMEILIKAIKVQINSNEGVKEYSMNEDFVDSYAEDLNKS